MKKCPSCVLRRAFDITCVYLLLIAVTLQGTLQKAQAYQTTSEQDNLSTTTEQGITQTSLASAIANGRDTSILGAIEKFESSFGRSQNESEANHVLDTGGQWSGRPPASNKQNAQAGRKLIRSRYRLRSTNGDMLTGQQLAATSNYSQPFDGSPLSIGEQRGLGRALSGGATPVVGSGGAASSAGVDSTAPYAYLSTPAQRASSHHSSVEESGSSAFLDEPTSLYSVADNPLEYRPPLHQGYNPAATSRMYSTSINRMRSPPAASASEMNLPYYLASPSVNYGDYYGAGGSADYPSSEHDNYYGTSSLMRNISDHMNFGQSPYASTSSLFHPDMAHYGAVGSMSPRSRWSWPWTDISAVGNPMAAATFKKHHHHHHHMPAQHKEHDHHHHHEENDHMMSKWEHGITIGEIACIAIAVILGVIILGSPFFLLFLMLFNGGNLFGATQMGLLAPAAVPAGGGPAAGRRRKRSIEVAADKQGSLTQEELRKLKDSDLGDHLFERLSPFLNPDKLMRSFERIMEVKDDIERIVAKLNQGSTATGEQTRPDYHQHSEMRRRK